MRQDTQKTITKSNILFVRSASLFGPHLYSVRIFSLGFSPITRKQIQYKYLPNVRHPLYNIYSVYKIPIPFLSRIPFFTNIITSSQRFPLPYHRYDYENIVFNSNTLSGFLIVVHEHSRVFIKQLFRNILRHHIRLVIL